MRANKSTHEIKRDIIAELYKNGPESVDSISKNADLTIATVYNNLRRVLVEVIDVKIVYPEGAGGIFGKRFRTYSLKKEYVAGIKACEDCGVDILNLVSYSKK